MPEMKVTHFNSKSDASVTKLSRLKPISMMTPTSFRKRKVTLRSQMTQISLWSRSAELMSPVRTLARYVGTRWVKAHEFHNPNNILSEKKKLDVKLRKDSASR